VKASDCLRETFKAKVAEGLVDMKFYLSNVDEATTEDVCAEVNAMLDAIQSGDVVRIVSWGDSHGNF